MRHDLAMPMKMSLAALLMLVSLVGAPAHAESPEKTAEAFVQISTSQGPSAAVILYHPDEVQRVRDKILLMCEREAESGRKSVRGLEHALADLDALTATDLLDLTSVARAIGFAMSDDLLDSPVSPRGFRLLARVPRLPEIVNERLVGHFGGLQKLLAASIDDLQAVEGVGEARARTVREGLSRLAESSILERYV